MNAIRFFQGPNVSVKTSLTLWSPDAETSATFANSSLPREPCSPQRFSDATTSAEVMAWPSWNCTPSRRWMVMVLPSALTSSPDASSGCGS